MPTSPISPGAEQAYHRPPLHQQCTPPESYSANASSLPNPQWTNSFYPIASRSSSTRYPQISSPSSSSRHNRIHVRIKRANKTKIPKMDDDDIDNRFRFNPSTSIPSVQMQIVNHFHHHHHHSATNNQPSSSSADRGSNQLREQTAMCHIDSMDQNRFSGRSLPRLPSFLGHHRSVEGNANANNFLPLLRQSLSEEKKFMTKRLLELERGPIAWCSIEVSNGPPQSFVWYLARVLAEGVQVFLEQNTGKEYWVKHVTFWSNLLDPESHWWNTREGASYKDIARKFSDMLRRRWGDSTVIEYGSDDRAETLFVRACILFARKSIDRANQ